MINNLQQMADQFAEHRREVKQMFAHLTDGYQHLANALELHMDREETLIRQTMIDAEACLVARQNDDIEEILPIVARLNNEVVDIKKELAEAKRAQRLQTAATFVLAMTIGLFSLLVVLGKLS